MWIHALEVVLESKPAGYAGSADSAGKCGPACRPTHALVAAYGTKPAGDAGCADSADTADLHQSELFTVPPGIYSLLVMLDVLTVLTMWSVMSMNSLVGVHGTQPAGDAGCADSADAMDRHVNIYSGGCVWKQACW